MTHTEAKNPVAERAAKRREVWECERLLEVIQQYKAGLLTKEEARDRGIPIY